jgi:DNA (cytosine-5)-methyltransferase 1
MKEITVVGFAGGGGSCEGIKMALGYSPTVALNHDEVAVAMHTANHPDTIHYCQNIWKAVPTEVLREVQKKLHLKRLPKIGLAWFSPDCKHFSKAKGGKPVEKRIRDLAWVILGWAKLPRSQRPRIIKVENVEEFIGWGPLGADGLPDPARSGEYFRRWVNEFKRRGYKAEWREIVAANKGSPTTRKRLFIIFRNDGLPIVWPEDTHAKPTSPFVIAGKRAPWRTAAEIIDWSLPCPSIFDTSEEIKAKYGIRAIRPLAENTLARIARGVQRYVIGAAEPFIVPITHTGDDRVHGLDEPLRTVTTAHRGEHALITPFLAGVGSRAGQSPERPINGPAPTVTATKRGQHAIITPFVTKFNKGVTGHRADEPLHTITTSHSETHPGGCSTFGVVTPFLVKNNHALGTCVDGQKHALVAAFLAQHNTDMVGHDVREPLSTIVQKGCTQAVVSAGLVNLKGSDRRQASVEAPMQTQCAGGWHIAEVRAFLTKFHRDGGQLASCDDPMHTVPCTDSFGLVTVMIGGEPYAIVDIGMRMLTPRELFRAQGFPDNYIIDRGLFADGWRPITKTDQIRMCGNSVCPQVAAALVAANYQEIEIADSGIPAFALEAAE